MAASFFSAEVLSGTFCSARAKVDERTQFYNHLLAPGKAKKVALVVCMIKLLTILNAMIRDEKNFAEMVRSSTRLLAMASACRRQDLISKMRQHRRLHSAS
ncbi:hypothetical protein [Pseudomonas sp. 210_17 TE3656]